VSLSSRRTAAPAGSHNGRVAPCLPAGVAYKRNRGRFLSVAVAPCPAVGCVAHNWKRMENTPSKLVDCPDCGQQVSRRAPSCPHCGSPLNSTTPPARKTLGDRPIPNTTIPVSRTRQHPHGKSCQLCGSNNVGKVRGLQGFGEVLTFLVLFCLGMIPGIVYYIYNESRPYCSGCGKRR